jgi:hypothetical protein
MTHGVTYDPPWRLLEAILFFFFLPPIGSHDHETYYSDHQEMTADLKIPMTSNSSPIAQNNSTRTI